MTSTNMADIPVKLGSRDALKAALACEEAFRDSAFTRYLFPSAEPLDRGVVAMFEFVVRYATLYGEAFAPTGAVEAVACWYGQDGLLPSFWRLVRAGGLTPALKDREAWRRLIAVEPYLAETRKRWMKNPHRYLDLFAVRPTLQGQGFGATLLRHMLGRCDASRLSCCVETFTEGNVAMYRHFGFDIVEVVQDTPLGEAVYFMVREPRPAQEPATGS
ncbi:GNAT family N-acetyltransferase [Chloroflexota bacterium]